MSETMMALGGYWFSLSRAVYQELRRSNASVGSRRNGCNAYRHNNLSGRKHELAILDRQMEQMKLGHNQRLEEISVEADIAESQALYKHDGKPSGVKWVDGLRASVRPVITYAFFTLFTV